MPSAPAIANARRRAYSRTPEGRARDRARAHTDESRFKQAVRHVVLYAVKTGRLHKPDGCEKCGAAHPEAHHEDYMQPLVVEWLCVKCHGLTRRKEA